MGENSSSSKIKLRSPPRHESGTVAKEFTFVDALAAVRRRAGSDATGPATQAERATMATLMRGAGYEAVFEAPGVDYEAAADELDMSADELRDLVTKR
jgi:hypothetical protein